LPAILFTIHLKYHFYKLIYANYLVLFMFTPFLYFGRIHFRPKTPLYRD